MTRITTLALIVLVTGCSQGRFTPDDISKLNKMCQSSGGVKYYEIAKSSKAGPGEVKTIIGAVCSDESAVMLKTKVGE